MPLPELLSWFRRELRRRRVVRVTLAYAVAAWVAVQVVETTFPHLNLPGWTVTFVIVVALAGMPVVVALAWAFDVTPQGVRRTPPAAPPPRTALAGRPRLFGRGGLVGGFIALSAAAVVGAWLLGVPGRPTPPSSGDAHTLAVFPFAVQTTAELAYLREGMVTLLARKLDGAGDLRSVDPRAVLGLVDQEGGGAPDADRGREISTRLGAGLFVTGEIVEVGRRLHLSAALHRIGAQEPLEEASVEGEVEELAPLVDHLAARILARLPGVAGGALARLDAITSPSLDAVVAYLDGERLLRVGYPDSAVAAFERAIAFDSAFALGYYRLGIAHMAIGQDRPALFREAESRSERLAERDRQLVRAAAAWSRTGLDEAEAIYRRLLARYPDEVETWFWLGELLFHNAPSRGEGVERSKEAWLEVLKYEPENAFALMHLSRVAAVGRDQALLDSLVRMLPETVGYRQDRRLIEVLLHHALTSGEPDGGASPQIEDAAGLDSLTLALSRLPENQVVAMLEYLGAFSRHPEGVARMAAELTPLLTDTARARAGTIAAHLHLARGRRRAALESLASVESVDPHKTALVRANAVLLPLVGAPREELERARAGLDRLVGGFADSDAAELGPMRLFLRGMLALELDGAGAAAAYADSLAAWSGDPAAAAYARSRSFALRARLAAGEDRVEDALAALDSIRHPLNQSPTFEEVPSALDRWLRAELLARAGRPAEAIRWLDAMAQSVPEEIALLAPSHLRRGELYEDMGEVRSAVLHYRRFVELWDDCDPELRPLVRRAEGRLQALGYGGEARPD